ncbi:hypothetical protein E2C01_098219 [Portunus trituberculatus]|uniref:Uncharacterized protein n=1 Tax=Portunus trituberculatus TaxID=210409 RepID=A0A5B7KDG5_PORTR|nr:hypothetical protein [Portunus trituberculatus]
MEEEEGQEEQEGLVKEDVRGGEEKVTEEEEKENHQRTLAKLGGLERHNEDSSLNASPYITSHDSLLNYTS